MQRSVAESIDSLLRAPTPPRPWYEGDLVPVLISGALVNLGACGNEREDFEREGVGTKCLGKPLSG
jgi:hypothetical protein